MTVRRHADDLGGALFAVVQNTAALARIGVALPAEGDRWQIVLGGYFGDAATRTRDGVRTFARTLPDRAISDLLANDWLGEPASFRFPFSRRQHWERAARLPPGLVVGDAVASFNPLYGQGMSSAALQAEALGALLDRVGNSPRLPHAFAKATAAVVANPWQIATGRRPRLRPDPRAQRAVGTGLLNHYLARVLAVAAEDRTINLALSRVQQLLAPPATLLRPAILWRVLTAVRSPRSGPADRSAPTNRADQGQTLDQPPVAGSRLVTRGSATGSRGPASSG